MATYTATATKLAEMFTANTGRHMLDSGNAYGRNWERHAGKTVGDFLSAPYQHIDTYGTPSLSAFHYLNENLTYAPKLDALYSAYDAERPNDGYLETVYEWLESIGVDTNDDETYGGVWDYNSYNNEYCLLDQTIQVVFFSYDNDAYVALQIHGGCDVRGGYTKPVIFYGGVDEVALGGESARFYCPSLDHTFSADYSNGEITDTDLGESLPNSDMLIPVSIATEVPKGWELQHGCPVCKSPLQ